MNFRRHKLEEPEINLIPFIDVLLVILIFLMLSTTYSRFTELQLALPVANAEQLKDRPDDIVVSIAADGTARLNQQPVDGRSVEILTAALAAAAGKRKDTMVVISADALAAHQSVINVLDAARRAGLAKLTFAAQAGANGAKQ